MSEIVLTAEVRQAVGKQAKHTRTRDTVPGVYYARGEQNINIIAPVLVVNKLVFTSETHVIDLKLNDGTTRKCILRDVQFDPVTDRPVHFDLQGLKETEKLTVDVPIVLTGGTAKGVRDGGMLSHMIHKIKVSCLPKDIPEKIEINVVDLGINASIHVSDLSIPNVTMLENPGVTLVAVLPPHVTKEPTPAEATEEQMKEPEVVGKGKKAEEGEEGAEAAPKKTEAAPKKEEK